jgi:hypothetical protein
MRCENLNCITVFVYKSATVTVVQNKLQKMSTTCTLTVTAFHFQLYILELTTFNRGHVHIILSYHTKCQIDIFI